MVKCKVPREKLGRTNVSATCSYCILLAPPPPPSLSLSPVIAFNINRRCPPPRPKSVWCLEHPFLPRVDHHIFSHSSPSVRSRRREAPLFSLLHNLTGLPGFHPHLVVLVLLTRSVPCFVFISNLPSPYPLPIPPHPCAMGGKIVFSEHRSSVVLESGHTQIRATVNWPGKHASA
ncbi:hypothetical protein BDP81DRAFT_198294 [Colletotrichum phormii]|uniref:Uncharacterized protein n=1 Tax=Colletotrichum phormii TaxID=359342 RepID=A0AAI9ZVW8_9PEZI|nr:uncharacterized protein BDP81DRAFT_198294 [Colletotrichum phormii]KAK1639185.1 hypothetical protein BDP81DRAFT_198294 [Colletotrichum phormii]